MQFDYKWWLLGIFLLLSWLFEKFSPRKPLELVSREELKRQRDKAEEGLVMITFYQVPISGKFRYHKKWWKKVTFKNGVTEMGEQLEIDIEAAVGVFLKDIPEYKRIHILSDEDE